MIDNTSQDNSPTKTVTIIVNGREKQYDGKRISFEQVVTLAFGTYEDNENIVYTVTYSKGEDKKEGSMVKGDDVKVKDGMIFNVSRTDKS
ncbi:MAG: multiubiquitin domain-containing protein [bacterium]|nr:multiubiquitin domain-containing protein [bacterium]